MTALSKHERAAPKLLKLGALALIGGVVGYGVGWLLAERGGLASLQALGWSDAAALIVASLLLASGVAVLVAARSGRALAAATQAEGPARTVEVKDMRLQGAIVILSGLLLATPVVAALAGNPAPVSTFAALMAVFVVHGLMNLTLWRRGDEMIRRVIAEAGAAAFWIGQAALFAWAAAERLGVAPPLTTWDVLVVLMGLYLVCSASAGLRRGLN